MVTRSSKHYHGNHHSYTCKSRQIQRSKVTQNKQKYSTIEPVIKRMSKEIPKAWNCDVEEAYRFQLAGYKDLTEYLRVNKLASVERWPHNNYIKKLQRKDGCYYYFNKDRECSDSDLRKIRLYSH